jgi:hypothetical protein
LCDVTSGNIDIDVDTPPAAEVEYKFIFYKGAGKITFSQNITTMTSVNGYTETNRTGSFVTLYYIQTDDAILYGDLTA